MSRSGEGFRSFPFGKRAYAIPLVPCIDGIRFCPLCKSLDIVKREKHETCSRSPQVGGVAAGCCLSKPWDFLIPWSARRLQNEHSLSKSKCTDQGGLASPDRLTSNPGAAVRRQHIRKTVRKLRSPGKWDIVRALAFTVPDQARKGRLVDA